MQKSLSHINFCRADITLLEIFREDGVPEVEAIEDVPAAFERAVKEKGEDGMLFCVGSLYLVGEIKAVIRRKKL